MKHPLIQKTALFATTAIIAAASILCACDDDDATGTETPSVDADLERPAGWSAETHGVGTEPDYDGLFNDELGSMKVHRFDLVISDSVYSETMNDLEELLGGCGQGGGGPGGGGAGESADPVWVPIEVRFDGLSWTQVGMRYKGNSSLNSAWRSCTKKLSFRLDFDQFEEEYPAVLDQRFFGFKKMTFSNGYKDSSLIRDKLAADIFRRGGIPAARGAFAQVYATIGDSEPIYFGMYTMIEDPSNRMLDSQFEDDSGNLYKPESQFGAGLSGTALQAEFEKKTNEEDADWSDVSSVLQALHAENRLSDPGAWRTNLEQYLNVSSLLRWLAINQAMVNWDTYGCMAHNYYVYADPSDATAMAPNGRLNWFPWDLNESLLVSGRCNFSDPDGLVPGENSIGNQWPLVRYILDDAAYASAYEVELANAVATSGAMDADWVKERIAAYHSLISPYVVGPEESEQAGYSFLTNDSSFTQSAGALQSFVESRVALVLDVLSE